MKTMTKISMTVAMTVGLTGAAFAGDPKAGAPAPAAKKDEAAKAPAPAADAKKMEPMKAPQELADMAKMAGGTWKCTGKAAMDPSDMTKTADMKMTMTMKLDLNNFWIKGDMTATGGMGFKGTMYTTYDPTAKKWVRLMVDSMGGSEMDTSMGMKDNKVVWEGEARSSMPGMATMKVRTTEEMDPKGKTSKLLGEGSMDGGKKWMMMWSADCKK